jgi:anti-sigma regulatory factor (Ser/Thr protein kinase)
MSNFTTGRGLCAPGVYVDTYERLPESAAAARRLVRHALETWQMPQLADTALVVLTELVSNAVRHASGAGMRVTIVRLTERRVSVSVTDRDSARPQMRIPDLVETGGRGLCIVTALSASWGVDLLPSGKRVWADLEVP